MTMCKLLGQINLPGIWWIVSERFL